MSLRLPCPLLAAVCLLLGLTLPLAAQTPAPSPAPAAAGAHADFLKDLKPTALVNASGSTVPLKKLADKKYLFIYFSGKHCYPCKFFTPKLIEFYKKQAPTGDFEVLFVSEDPDADTMKAYMAEAHMPWLAIKHGDPVVQKIKARLQQKGFPMLYLLNENDEVIGKPVYRNNGDHASWNPVNIWEKAHSLPESHWPFDYKAMQEHRL